MTVTKLIIGSTRGTNKRPTSGGVFFADGAAYDWFIHPITDEVFFSTHRYQGGSAIPFSFRSPKRAAALLAKLEG